MTTVKCSYSSCEYCVGGTCQRDEIELDDSCQDWLDHTDVSPEYCHTFWKHCHTADRKKEYKTEARGKRYEILGLVWYTDQDDRNGTDKISFTEEVSGVGIMGKDINEKNLPMIKENIAKVAPVKTLPDEWEVMR